MSATPETDRIARLLENLDEWIDDSLRKSKPIGLTLCAARSTIADHRARITEMWDALETLRRERDEARAKFVAAIDGRDMANEEADKLRAQNAKLREIAERLSICAEDLEKYTWHCNDQGCDCGRCKLAIEQKELRAELDQIKEGEK